MKRNAPQSDQSKRRTERPADASAAREITSWPDEGNLLSHLSQELLHRNDEDRRKIARDLHDTTAQTLVAASMALSRLEAEGARLDPGIRALLAEGKTHVDQSLREIRALCYLLHPPLLDETGLASAVSWYANSFAKESGIRLELSLPDRMLRLPRKMEIAIFRIVQESLDNVRKHTKSSTAKVRIETTRDSLLAVVEDEGQGIDQHVLEKIRTGEHPGIGIAGIRERTKQLGGRLEICSGIKGTEIRIAVPLPGGES